MRKKILLGPKAARECPKAQGLIQYDICHKQALIQFPFKTAWRLGPKDSCLSKAALDIEKHSFQNSCLQV